MEYRLHGFEESFGPMPDGEALSHIRCRITMERSQHGQKVWIRVQGLPGFEEVGYSVDGGQSWREMPLLLAE